MSEQSQVEVQEQNPQPKIFPTMIATGLKMISIPNEIADKIKKDEKAFRNTLARQQ